MSTSMGLCPSQSCIVIKRRWWYPIIMSKTHYILPSWAACWLSVADSLQIVKISWFNVQGGAWSIWHIKVSSVVTWSPNRSVKTVVLHHVVCGYAGALTRQRKSKWPNCLKWFWNVLPKNGFRHFRNLSSHLCIVFLTFIFWSVWFGGLETRNRGFTAWLLQF